MFALFDEFISVRRLGVGRRLFALRDMKTRASARDNPGLVQVIEAAIVHDETQTQPLNARWKQALREPQAREQDRRRGREADLAFDDLLGGVDGNLASTPRVWGRDSERAQHAQVLRRTFFPAGVGEIIRSSWVDEVEQGRRIVREARGERLQPLIAALQLEPTITRLAAIVADLDAALKQDRAGLAFSEVRRARVRGQNFLRAAIAKALGDYALPTAENEAARLDLLAPVLEQDAAVHNYLRLRRRVPDVDPGTGQELEGEETPEEEEEDGDDEGNP